MVIFFFFFFAMAPFKEKKINKLELKCRTDFMLIGVKWGATGLYTLKL